MNSDNILIQDPTMLDSIVLRGDPNPNPIGSFQVVFNATTNGTTVSFILVDNTSIYVIRLKRNFTADYGSAVVLNTWNGQQIENGQTITFDDTAPEIANNPNVSYWVDCVPQLNNAGIVTIGPQGLTVNLDQTAPDPIVAFSVSHGAVVGGVVQIGIVFTPPNEDRFGSCLIRVSGYNGIAAAVDIAQNQTSPFAFPLEQTGETITLTAVSVSKAGVRCVGTNPTASLTLGATATIPAKILAPSATELTTGVQISFPASPESNVTQYSVFRGPRGQGFAAASSIGTVTATGAAGYSFLDTSGLTGVFEWFVYATNSAGNGTASGQILPIQVSLTSANQPINSPVNTTNFASVTSSNAGADATIDVSGFAGAGTSWNRPTGFGTQTLPHFTIQHKAYDTGYWVVWDTSALIGRAFTDGPSSLGDNYAFAGSLRTIKADGTGGSTGGGGSSGGNGGGFLFPDPPAS